MNLGSTDETTLSKSRAVLLDEVQRCDRLGLLYYNIHPGLNNKSKNLEALTTVHFLRIDMRKGNQRGKHPADSRQYQLGPPGNARV